MLTVDDIKKAHEFARGQFERRTVEVLKAHGVLYTSELRSLIGGYERISDRSRFSDRLADLRKRGKIQVVDRAETGELMFCLPPKER